jgi:hypothetical protein
MNPLAAISARALTILVLLAIIAALVFGYGERRYDQGVAKDQAANLKRDNVALAKANTTIQMLQADARAKEQANAEKDAAISAQYQKELQHEKVTLDRIVTDLRTGVVRLRIQLARARTAPGDSAAAPGTSPGGCDGAETGELSPAASEFLVGLASEADDVTHQLTACQAVVIADRQINQPQGKP